MRALLALLLLPGLALARSVSVSGKCEIKVTPDRGSVQFQMQLTRPQINQAVEGVTKSIDQLRDAIKRLGLKDLELRTTQFQVDRNEEWVNGKNVFKGNRATMSLEVVTSEIARLGEAMGEAAKIGINGTSNYRTFLSLEKSQNEYLKCLDVAAEDARKKAVRLADKLGARVDEVESIVEGTPQYGGPTPYYNLAMLEASAAPKAVSAPTIDVGDQQYSTNVQVSFKLK